MNSKQKSKQISFTILENEKITNYIRWKDYNNSEELYLDYYQIDKPKCKYCDNPAKFKSFHKGYFDYCNFDKHKKELRLNSLIKRANTIRTESERIDGYDDFIFKNMNFYLSNDYPKKDLFDGKYLRSLTKVKNKSKTKLKFFDVKINCIFCDKEINYNVFNYNKLYCNSKTCVNLNIHHNDFETKKLLYDFSIAEYITIKKKNKLNISLKEIQSLKSVFGFEKTIKIISNKAIIYDDLYLEREREGIDYSFKLNGLHDMLIYRYCVICQERYIYQDIRIDENFNKKFNIIGATYNCKSPTCYHSAMKKKLYNKSEEVYVSNSKKLKDKIKNGEFTPCVTNSWANSKIFLKIFNMNFRSSWEAYFYIYMRKNNNELEYEKIRIPYFDSEMNKNRNYITDFQDFKNKIIYEIKPDTNLDSQNTKDKEYFAKLWCSENGYTFKYISDGWFKSNYDENILDVIEDEDMREKIKKSMKQFRKDNNEKDK